MTLSADVDFIAKYSVGKFSPQFNRRFKSMKCAVISLMAD